MAVTHMRLKDDNGRTASPAQQIIIDAMTAMLSCIAIRGDMGQMMLMDFVRGNAEQYALSDDKFVDVLRKNGYHVESSNTSLTISIPQ